MRSDSKIKGVITMAARKGVFGAALLALILTGTNAAAQGSGWPQGAGGLGEDGAQAIAVDSAGNVYTAGRFEGSAVFGTTTLNSAGSTDIFVAKKDSVGNWKWVQRAGGGQADQATGIAVDASGNVYVTGSFRGTANFDAIALAGNASNNDQVFAAKLDQNGAWRWAARATGPGASIGRAISVNSVSEAYVTGAYNSATTFDGATTLNTAETHSSEKDVFVAKLNDAGAWRWAIGVGGDVSPTTTGANCLYNPDPSDWRRGNSVSDQRWCCNAWGSCGTYPYWFGTYTIDERYCQYDAWGSPDAAANALYGRNVCVPGQTIDAHSDDQGTAIKVVSSNGADQLPGTADDTHSLFVAGYFQGNLQTPLPLYAAAERQRDLFVARINDRGSSATFRWSLDTVTGTASGVGADFIGVNALEVVANTPNDLNVYVAGSYSGAPRLGSATLAMPDAGSQTHAFVAKIGDTGGASANWQWQGNPAVVARPNTTYGGFAIINGLSVDKGVGDQQGVYVTGEFRNDVAFTPTQTGTVALSNFSRGTNNLDVFGARVRATDGRWAWAKRGGSLFNDQGLSIAADTGGTTFVAGRFQGVGIFADGLPTEYAEPTRGTYDVSETSYTSSLWFKTTCGNCGIFSAIDVGGGSHDRHIYLQDGNLKVRVWNNEVLTAEAFVKTEQGPQFANFADGQWHHVAHVLGGGQAHRLYIDGVQRAVGVRTTSDFNWQTDIAIGFSTDAEQDALDGLIQNVQLFDAAKTAAEVVALRDATQPAESNALVRAVSRSDAVIASLGPDRPGNWRSVEKWLVGQIVPAPPGSLPLQPEIKLGLEDGSAHFYWHAFDKKLYAIRPVSAQIHWKVSASPIDARRILTFGRAEYPKNPILHVAGTPVPLELPAALQVTNPATFASIKFSDNGASATEKVFNANTDGHAVILYVRAAVPDDVNNPVALEVIRTVQWSNTKVLSDNVSCTIGSKLTNGSHSDFTGKNGWVVFPRSAYDGFGLDRAHDRATRTGPIVPVNKSGATVSDMVVAWFARSQQTGVAWPSSAFRYDCQWPTFPEQIVIASEKGSELPGQALLQPTLFNAMRIYNQADPNQAGYNPNDEHAAFWPSNTGTGLDALFALRSDLGVASEPYTLLKYNHPETGERLFRVYKVVATNGQYTGFVYAGTAGNPVFPPYPVRLMGACPETRGEGAPFWKDHKNQVYARSALHTIVGGVRQDEIISRYYYPLDPAFVYDLDKNGVGDKAVGQCVPWLDRLAPAVAPYGTPIAVKYRICWPDEGCAVKPEPVPMLQVGETLTSPKRGLPAISSQAAVSVVFDQQNPYQRVDGAPLPTEPSGPATQSLVQLIDPYNERKVALAKVPSSIKTENRSGKVLFMDLPFHLRSRISYDPINKLLGFKGYFDPGVTGEPTVLINVMSARERLVLRNAVASSDSDKAAYQTAIDKLYHLSRNPRGLRLGSPRPATPNEALYVGLKDDRNSVGDFVAAGDGVPEPVSLLGVSGALTAGASTGTGYVVVAFNNDPSLGAAPVSLKVIKVGCGPYQGQVNVIYPDNVFDEKLTLRHSGDFGGNPDALTFEWYTQPVRPAAPGVETGPGGIPPAPCPEGCTPGGLPDMKGWVKHTTGVGTGVGVLDITIEGADIKTLSDNWFLVRYKGFPVCSNQPPTAGHTWSAFAGQPSEPTEPLAQLAPGWIKRVTEGLNPFDARVRDFHKAPTNTYASMLSLLGRRYEGDIALNASAENLNNIGLIEAYTTVLRRGMSLSVSGTPPVNYGPANQALLLAASKIADFYALLGNEAFADALDPMIGFDTKSAEYGSLAPSIFTFQNQLDSLLEEELALLRGRDETGGGVVAPPVYNRLFWNFTNGEGEVAYQTAYNIGDANRSGVIDEADAKVMFPQAHGDAWGHYLTGIKTYYDLLRHPYFTWEPITEQVKIGASTVMVDYLDERKFARLASAKAKAGAEVVNLTYRGRYVENPLGQFQGYKDTDPERAWGFTEWARRAGQGAYYDWVVANSILPAVDPNPAHTGIQKIDRTTVTELDEIIVNYENIQGKLNEADEGLNPLGLAKGVVPFDIDPALVDGTLGSGVTHYEQIHERSLAALNNAVTTFDHANSLSRMLRQNQDTLTDFSTNATEQESDFRNRLIEVFGYPYADDIGGAGYYPTGYDGPDLVHYSYIDRSDLTGDRPAPQQPFIGYMTPIPGVGFHLGDQANANTNIVKSVPFTQSLDGFGLVKPTGWLTQRRSIGEIQRKLADIYTERARYEQSLKAYDNHLKEIQDEVSLLQTQYNVNAETIKIRNRQKDTIIGLNAAIGVMKAGQIVLRRVAATIAGYLDAAVEGVPKVIGLATDGLSGVRGALKGGSITTQMTLESVADGINIVENSFELSKEQVGLQADIDVELQGQIPEVQAKIKHIEQLVRQEPSLRLDAQIQGQILKGTQDEYHSTLAEGQRIMDDLVRFRTLAAGDVQEYRYQDMAFRIFRNDALQKYRAQFDLAARYAYLDATAYDYETNLLDTSSGSGQQFLTDIVRQRSLGQIIDGEPVAGSKGLGDVLARLGQNFEVLKGQMGFNNPQAESNAFSLRKELFRQFDRTTTVATDPLDTEWRTTLEKFKVADLWSVPEFRRYCRPFAPESAGKQPGLVIPFSSTVTFGLNFFGWPLGGGDTAYDPSQFSTRVHSVGVWFGDYNHTGLSSTPRVYLVPAGADVLRSPGGDDFTTREWRVSDQSLPVPFPVGAANLSDESYIPLNDSLSESLGATRRHSSFRAHHLGQELSGNQMSRNTRIVGRSVWNTRWLLIVPGGTLLFDPKEGLEQLVNGKPVPGGTERDGQGISDIQLLFNTYAYSGN